jgi:prolyl oligopeptidase
MRSTAAFLLFVLLLVGCASPSKSNRLPSGTNAADLPPDENLWLEDIHSKESMAWVKKHNESALAQLAGRPDYKKNTAAIHKIVFSKDRLPGVTVRGGYLYNFWQDARHTHGIWRRTSLESFRRKSPRWETILDLDQLSKKEKQNWVWQWADCLSPEFTSCLVSLSPGGGDGHVVREFDIAKKDFVKDGFYLPYAKSRFSWIDQNHILVGTDFGPGSLTQSGYPRVTKILTRGTDLAKAQTVFEGEPSDMVVTGGTFFTRSGQKSFIERQMSFYTSQTYALDEKTGRTTKIDKPDDAGIEAWQSGQIILRLRSDWKGMSAGSIVGLDQNGSVLKIFSPNEKQSVESVDVAGDDLIVNYNDNIRGRLAKARFDGAQWSFKSLDFPYNGNLSLMSTDRLGDLVIARYESFLTPPSLLAAHIDSSSLKVETLKSLPHQFNSNGLVSEQLWATSKDGTKIPYFIVHRRNMVNNGKNPVLLHAYGGFEISQTPFYSAVIGRLWLERGGVFVEANIRGGGEFGPAWHKAALKENRQRAYDDFAAVAEDLIARQITQPRRIGIYGGSNGGLLVGVAFEQRPDLYGAVVCEKPLLDMMRYNQLLAGASWVGEYGDPNDPDMRKALLKYSPYQNMQAGTHYPPVLFYTSTLDDRVHPGHARKMAARMEKLGYAPIFYEDVEGGHALNANLNQSVRRYALVYTFLQRLLSP